MCQVSTRYRCTDDSEQAFYRTIGMAKDNLGTRWHNDADSLGTGGDPMGDKGNKYPSQLCATMGPEAFCANWRIQVIRVCDKDDVRDVEQEMKRALCTYHLDTGEEKGDYQLRFGLNGN